MNVHSSDMTHAKATVPRPDVTTILVVDDSQLTLTAAQSVLEEQGHTVVVTDNPIMVPYLLAVHEPSLLLIDVQMPAVSGDDVVRTVRSAYKFGRATRPPTLILYSTLDATTLGDLASSSGAPSLARVPAESESKTSIAASTTGGGATAATSSRMAEASPSSTVTSNR